MLGIYAILYLAKALERLWFRFFDQNRLQKVIKKPDYLILLTRHYLAHANLKLTEIQDLYGSQAGKIFCISKTGVKKKRSEDCFFSIDSFWNGIIKGFNTPCLILSKHLEYKFEVATIKCILKKDSFKNKQVYRNNYSFKDFTSSSVSLFSFSSVGELLQQEKHKTMSTNWSTRTKNWIRSWLEFACSQLSMIQWLKAICLSVANSPLIRERMLPTSCAIGNSSISIDGVR